MDRPRTRYALSGGVHIAYQVAGEGSVDLVWAPGGFQHVELWWESRHRAELTEKLTAIGRVLLFDRRGTGLSDRTRGLPPLEVQMDDVLAVLDASGSEKALLCAMGQAAPLMIVFAATYPERTLGLLLWGPAVAFARKPDLPWLPEAAELERQIAEAERELATTPDFWERMLLELAPSLETDEERREFARSMRLSVSPGDWAAYQRMLAATDVRHVLPSVRVPTLVLAREAWQARLRNSRYAAERIPTARLAVLPGTDYIPPTGDIRPLVEEVARFVDELRAAPAEESERVLATVLFTDIVGSTARAAELGDAAWRELLREHHSRVRRELARFRGRELDTAGDGFFATFEGPARAIRCACAVRESLRELELEIRAGLHAGECELLDGKVTGIAVSLGARIAGLAQPGEVLVSSTVRDLVAGSGLAFADRGSAELKGIPGEWQLYAVEA